MNPIQRDDIQAAADRLRHGGIVAFPTETVYGLGADASNPAAVQKIFAIKHRPASHPLILHIGEIAQLAYWSRKIPASAQLLAERFWPGPLTLILKKSQHVPDCVTGGQDTVGIRIPAHPVALALLQALGPAHAIAAPSANLYGKTSPTTAAHVQTALAGQVDLILDGGPCTVGLESTIVSFDDDTVHVLRPGGVAVTDIESVLGKPVAPLHNTPAIRVSGSLPAHYAPSTPLSLHAKAALYQLAFELVARQNKIAVITCSAFDQQALNQADILHIPMPSDPVQYGQQLYAALHQCDSSGLDYILMEAPPHKPEWLAVSDRLQRASRAHQ